MSRLAPMKKALCIGYMLIMVGGFMPAYTLAVPLAEQLKSLKKEDPYQYLQQARELYQKDALKALDLIEKAILLSLEQDEPGVQAESYKLLGEINEYLKQNDLAASNYQRALQLYKSQNNTAEAHKLHKRLGDAYEKAGDNEKALKYYNLYLQYKLPDLKSKYSSPSRGTTSKMQRDRNQLNEVEEVRLKISEIYARQKDFGNALNSLNDAASNVDTLQDPRKKIIINEKIGDVYVEQDRDEEAVNMYNQNIRMAEELDEPEEIGRANDKIARIYAENRRLDDALSLRERSIEIYNLSGDTTLLAREYLERGKIENELNQMLSAQKSLEVALKLAQASGQKQTEREAYREISTLAEKQGRSGIALTYYKNYVSLQDSAFRERQKELEAELELNKSFNQQQQRIELLEKNDDLNRKTIQILRENENLARENMTNQRLLIYGLLAGILALVVTGYLMYKNMQQKKIANQLLALKSLRSQMNPHFIFNALNSVNHYISQKDERSANKYLSDFSRLMRAVLEHSQKDFISLQKETEIIALYLKLENDRFRDKFDFELKVDEELDQDHIWLPPMLVQPFVENAVWHGLRYREGKGLLQVHFKYQNEQLVIQIEDNGIGREESARLKTQNQQKNVSTGMSNIENRLQIINDMFRTAIQMEIIDLPAHSGTRVILRMPLKQNIS